MKDLIERLEKATGPDLDLDHAIAAVIKPEDGHGVLLYTGSVDAALTLVPEGWSWRVSGPDWSGGRRNMYFGYVRQYRKAGDGRQDAEGNARHTRAAIALCIAVLYALAMKSANPA